jgi:succinoglycan biosynthesis protein ExoO
MRFVFVTDELARPGAAGHLAMNHAIISWLQGRGHEVTVLLVGNRLNWPVEVYESAPVTGPAVFGWDRYVVAASPLAALKSLARGLTGRFPNAKWRRRFWAKTYGQVDAVLGSFTAGKHNAWCTRYIARTRPDAVIIDTMFRAGLLAEPAMPAVRSVIITHDVFHRRHLALRSAGYAVFPAELSRARETEFLRRAGAIAAIQSEEAHLLQDMCPDVPVFTAPMPAIPCPRPPDVTRLANRLVFVGSASLPNLDGLRWFLEGVWPHVRRWKSGITLDIVGDCGAALARVPEGVNRLGRVKNLAPVLHRAALAIAPLRVGSGLKIKLLDYARHGLFTIGTPAALAGFAADPAAPFIAARAEVAFAAAVIRQLGRMPDDPTPLSYVDRHYGIGPSFAGLGAALGLASPVPLATGDRAAISEG